MGRFPEGQEAAAGDSEPCVDLDLAVANEVGLVTVVALAVESEGDKGERTEFLLVFFFLDVIGLSFNLLRSPPSSHISFLEEPLGSIVCFTATIAIVFLALGLQLLPKRQRMSRFRSNHQERTAQAQYFNLCGSGEVWIKIAATATREVLPS